MPTKIKQKHLQTHETDLTHTATLHKEYAADLYKRFRRLKGLIRKAVVNEDIFNLKQRTPFSMRMALHQKVEILPNPKDFDFKTDATKVENFMGWLDERQADDILEITEVGPAGQVEARNPWQNTYVRRGYGKGIKHADAALRKEGVDVPTGERLDRIFNMPVHARTLEQLYTRNFMELKGITQAMDQQISRRLANGMAQGWNPRKVARKLNDRVDKIGITRARVLARTETIRAHYESSMSRYKQYNIEYVEFIFGGGPCPSNTCPPYDGKIFKVGEEVEIPLHPNCGCAYKPKVEKPDKVSKVEEVGRYESREKWFNNLGDKEKAAVDYWQEEGYRDIRKSQLGKEVSGDVKEKLKGLKSAIDDAPLYKGKTYRGLNNVDMNVIEGWIRGDSNIRLDAFASTSKKRTIAEGFLKTLKKETRPKNVLMEINSKTGKDISYFGEKEVLFEEGTEFEVKDIVADTLTDKDIGILKLVLEEVT